MDLDPFQENLRTIFPLANVQDKKDALFVALHVLMLEMDFVPQGSTYGHRFSSFPQDSIENSIHSVMFYYRHFPHLLCQINAVPLGQSMVVHGTLLNQDKNRAISLKIDDYVNFKLNTQAEDIFRNMKQLGLKFKDGFILPLLSDVYESAGIQPAFSFKNLPTYLKYNVLTYLPVQSLIAMSEVDKEFNDLTNFDFLWKNLYKRNFPNALPESTDQQHDWKSLYKEEFSRQKKECARRRIAWGNSRFDPLRMLREEFRLPPTPFFPGRHPVLPMLAPPIQDAFPHLHNRYIENPILRQMILRNPSCFPHFTHMGI